MDANERRQDGFIVTGPMDTTAWAPTILHAIEAALKAAESAR